MRILLVAGDLHPRSGGPPRVVVGQAVELARRGIDVEVAADCGPGEAAQVRAAWPQLAAAEVPVRLFPRIGPARLGLSLPYLSYLGSNLRRFSLAHIHGLWSLDVTATGLWAHHVGVPYVIAAHGMLDRWSLARSRAKKVLARRLAGVDRMLQSASGLQYGTQHEADEAARLRLAPRPFVVPNGIHVGDFRLENRDALDEIHGRLPGLCGRSPVVLFFSRIHPKKGIDLLVEAFAVAARDHPAAALLIAGIPEDATYEARLRGRCDAPDLRGRAFVTTDFVGDRGHIAVSAADVFALTSHEEGLSMAILEAMAYGLPLVISDRCRMPEVERVGAGLVVPLRIEAISDALRTLLSHSPAERAAMGAAGRRFVEEKYSWRSVGDRLCRMYGEVGAGAA